MARKDRGRKETYDEPDDPDDVGGVGDLTAAGHGRPLGLEAQTNLDVPLHQHQLRFK